MTSHVRPSQSPRSAKLCAAGTGAGSQSVLGRSSRSSAVIAKPAPFATRSKHVEETITRSSGRSPVSIAPTAAPGAPPVMRPAATGRPIRDGQTGHQPGPCWGVTACGLRSRVVQDGRARPWHPRPRVDSATIRAFATDRPCAVRTVRHSPSSTETDRASFPTSIGAQAGSLADLGRLSNGRFREPLGD